MTDTAPDAMRPTAWVSRRTGKHPVTLYRYVKEGRFPAPTFLGDRKFWPESAVEEWIRAEAARPRKRTSQLRNTGVKP